VAYVIYGQRAAHEDVNLSSLSGRGYKLRVPEGRRITSLVFAGDLNADGVGDLAIGDASARSGAGRVYVVFGVASR
jgi:hypothetical protein